MKTPVKHNFADFALVVDKTLIDTRSCSGEYGTWQLRFVNMSKGIDNLDYPDKYDSTGRMFHDLTISVQWTRTEHGKTYAWRFSYKDADINSIQAAEAHLCMMKRLDKAYRSMVITPQTFGQYATLMVRGIGVKTFVRKGERKDNPGWRSLQDNYYYGHSVDSYLAEYLDSAISQNYLPKPEAVNAA
jgi:hypothetical protein